MEIRNIFVRVECFNSIVYFIVRCSTYFICPTFFIKENRCPESDSVLARADQARHGAEDPQSRVQPERGVRDEEELGDTAQ